MNDRFRGADDQVALPVAGNGAVGDLGGALGDRHHVGDSALAGRAAPAACVCRAPRPQVAGQVLAEPAPGLHVERLVDRLVGDAHLRIVGIIELQSGRNLLRREPPLKHPGDRRRSRGTAPASKVLARRPHAGAVVGPRCPVASCVPPPADLAADRRRRSAPPPAIAWNESPAAIPARISSARKRQPQRRPPPAARTSRGRPPARANTLPTVLSVVPSARATAPGSHRRRSDRGSRAAPRGPNGYPTGQFPPPSVNPPSDQLNNRCCVDRWRPPVYTTPNSGQRQRQVLVAVAFLDFPRFPRVKQDCSDADLLLSRESESLRLRHQRSIYETKGHRFESCRARFASSHNRALEQARCRLSRAWAYGAEMEKGPPFSGLTPDRTIAQLSRALEAASGIPDGKRTSTIARKPLNPSIKLFRLHGKQKAAEKGWGRAPEWCARPPGATLPRAPFAQYSTDGNQEPRGS